MFAVLDVNKLLFYPDAKTAVCACKINSYIDPLNYVMFF